MTMRSVFCLLWLTIISSLAIAADPVASYTRDVAQILRKHCVACHDADEPKAKLNLERPATLESLQASGELWYKVLSLVESRAMPPDGESELSVQEIQTLRGWVEKEYTPLQQELQRANGRAKFRRLTRTEYANTFQDLFGIRPAVMQYLPEDGRIKGYDKVSGALPLSAASAEGYLKITDLFLETLFRTPKPNELGTVTAKAFPSEQSAGHILELDDGWKVSFNTDKTSCPNRGFNTTRSGIHKLRMHVYGYQTDKPLPFGIYIGSTGSYPQILELAQVHEAPLGKPAIIETEVWLDQRFFNDLTVNGDSIRLIPFGLGVQVPKNHQASKCRGPGLAFKQIDIEQPAWPTPEQQWLLADFPAELLKELRSNYKPSANSTGDKKRQSKVVNQAQYLELLEKTLLRILPRLYRRDIAKSEIAAHLADAKTQLDAGATLDRVFLDLLQEILTSPDFLCIVEKPGKLDDYALASRLAYFLWHSTPDEELLQLAAAKKLHTPTVLTQQVERLLADPKSHRMVTEFSNQWLGLHKIDDTTPDSKLYPEYEQNDLLKYSSVLETRRFLRELIDHDLSATHLIDADWTFANEALAKHYQLDGITGTELRKVNFPVGTPYGGIWTNSSILKTTANGTTTSPIKRGLWVAERLLGVVVPPPPPNISPVEPDVRGAKSLMELISLHRKGSCNACHANFDPYGFALESFDVTGQYRKHYRELDPELTKLPPAERRGKMLWRNGLPVESGGETPTGQSFGDIQELRRLMLREPQQLAYGLTCHLTTFATGAPITGTDHTAIQAIVAAARLKNYGVRSLIHALVQSEIFLHK